MISKPDFGFVLKAFIEKERDIGKISRWALQIYTDNDFDEEMSDILEYLFSMEDDPQFELTNEQLMLFAEKLMNNEQDVLQNFSKIIRNDSFTTEMQKLMNEINLSSDTTNSIKDYMTQNEQEKAFKILCEQIKIQKTNITSDFYDKVCLVGQFSNINPSIWLSLKEQTKPALE